VLHESELRFVKESGLWLSDNTVADATTARHGLLPKLPGGSSTFLRADGVFATPSSSPGAADPVDYTRRWWAHQADLDAVAYVTFNVDFTAFGGTGSSASDDDADARWIRNTSGAVSGNVANILSITGNKQRRDWKCLHAAHIKTYSDISSTRFWVGLFSGDPSASDDPAVHLAGFRYSTGAGDSNWMACVKDGSTLQAASTGITVAIDTRYFLRVETDSSEVRFYVDNALVYTHTANLPTGSTNMGLYVGVTTLTGSARSFRYARQYGSQIG
jgi:hypothetical protein